MKKLLFLLCILWMYKSSVAQPFYPTYSTYATDGLFNTSALPVKFINPNSNGETRIGYLDYGSGQYVPRIGFLQNDANMTAAKNSIGNVYDGSLTIHTGNNDEQVRITPAGNFGIGTASPAYKLDVNGTGNFTGTLKGSTAMFSGYGEFGNTITPANNAVALLLGSESNSNEGNSVRLGFKTKISLGGGIYTNAAIDAVTTNVLSSVYGSLAFSTMHATTMSEKMRITNDGNIGIGTTSPAAKLSIQGLSENDVNTAGIRLNNLWSMNGNFFLSSFVNPSTSDNNLRIGENAEPFMTIIGDSPQGGLLRGNIGIGTTTPDSKLTVAGKIHSREVKVTVNAGADFVFDDSYPLEKLEQVEKFIKVNRHLPEIAPAEEMEKNGLELGKMNIKLLQKIEELTLYLIEQNKELKEQGRKISDQQDEINQLKAKL